MVRWFENSCTGCGCETVPGWPALLFHVSCRILISILHPRNHLPRRTEKKNYVNLWCYYEQMEISELLVPCQQGMGAPKAGPLRGKEEAQGSHSSHLVSSQPPILGCYKGVFPPNHHQIWPRWGSGLPTLRPELSLTTSLLATEQNLARFYVYNQPVHFPTQPRWVYIMSYYIPISRTCPFSIAV